MRNVTIKDVAACAGVSAACVSRVLRGSGYVSEEKRKRVLDAVQQLGYRSLVEQPAVLRENTGARFIALFTLNNSHPLFCRISENISRIACAEKCYTATIYVHAGMTGEELKEQMEDLLQLGARGFIFNALSDAIDFFPIRKYLQSLSVPLVMIERTADIFNISKILINAREALFLAVQHLARNNHKNILFIGPEPITSVEKSRYEGFLYGLEAFDLSGGAAYFPVPRYSALEGENAMTEYLKEHPLPDAIVAADEILLGVMRYFSGKGICVPEDVSLIGLDNTFSTHTIPPVTTLAFPEKQMGSIAVDMILHGDSDSEVHTAREVRLSPYLIERASVCCRSQE